ncbi:MAG: MlaE family ABC transporter permease [Gemmatimonadales bacterium]|jgi:phospholipid/cholesterol/gamma-HCH transport system permease protein
MASPLLGPFRVVGRIILGALSHFGRFSLMCAEIIRGLGDWRAWVPRTVTEVANIGGGSLLIVIVISGFAGAVTAFQSGYQWQTSLPYYVLGTLIVSTVVLELGPVLVGLVLAGRIGARYAAELGTMRVTEQIDALESLGRSPVSHLIIPRVLAGFIVVPILVIIADVIAVIAGWYSVKQVLPITDEDFAYGAQYYYRAFDGYYSVIKAFFFGGAIALISCYMGFNTKQGAEGVGRSTTAAVVASSVVLLLINAILARVLLN